MGGSSCPYLSFVITSITMSYELSPQTEQYLSSIVAGGLFPTKEAALEAAVRALRNETATIPMIPAEHVEAVEQGIASAKAGRVRELSDADWENHRQHARLAASGNRPGN